MANRRYQQFSWSNATMPVTVYAQVNIGAAGAPTLITGKADILSVVRNSAGDYTFTFRSTFQQLLHVEHVINSGSAAPTSPEMYIKSNLTSSAKTMEVVFNAAGTATDPASGEILYLAFVFNNSSLSN